jgi:hypothetical protein
VGRPIPTSPKCCRDRPRGGTPRPRTTSPPASRRPPRASGR